MACLRVNFTCMFYIWLLKPMQPLWDIAETASLMGCIAQWTTLTTSKAYESVPCRPLHANLAAAATSLGLETKGCDQTVVGTNDIRTEDFWRSMVWHRKGWYLFTFCKKYYARWLLWESGTCVNDVWKQKKVSYVVGYTTYPEVPEK
jgi:hypothetical protein